MIFLKSHQRENPDTIFIDRKLSPIEDCRPIHFIKFPSDLGFSLLLLEGHETVPAFFQYLYTFSDVRFYFNFGSQFSWSVLIFHLSI